jgi:hypothetical protein
MHNIEDELIFTTVEGCVFHDSCGFECGSQDEVKIVQDFVRRKSRENRLTDRLHAIWFVPLRIYSYKFTKVGLQVLRSDGQRSARARFKVFSRDLPG